MKFLKYNLLLLLVILFTGCSEKTEIHHLYPQEFRCFFMTKDINIDHYSINFTKTLQKENGNFFYNDAWKNEWKNFITHNPNASKKVVEKQLKSMLETRDISGRINYINYETKEATGLYIDTFGSSFFGIVGEFGNWIVSIFGESTPLSAFLTCIGLLIIAALGATTVIIGVVASICLIAVLVTIWYLYPEVYIYLLMLLIIVGIFTGGTSRTKDRAGRVLDDIGNASLLND